LILYGLNYSANNKYNALQQAKNLKIALIERSPGKVKFSKTY